MTRISTTTALGTALQLASVGPDLQPVTAVSNEPSLSGDGRHLVYEVEKGVMPGSPAGSGRDVVVRTLPGGAPRPSPTRCG